MWWRENRRPWWEAVEDVYEEMLDEEYELEKLKKAGGERGGREGIFFARGGGGWGDLSSCPFHSNPHPNGEATFDTRVRLFFLCPTKKPPLTPHRHRLMTRIVYTTYTLGRRCTLKSVDPWIGMHMVSNS